MMNNGKQPEGLVVSDNLLRALVDTREQVQKTRIQFGNRLAVLADGGDAGSRGQIEAARFFTEQFEGFEARLNEIIIKEVREHPIFEYLDLIRGVGPMLSARLIAMIDITRAPHVSSLWRYAGLGVTDGKADRHQKGKRSHFNSRLKKTMYLIGRSMLMSNSPYRTIYDRAKERYMAREGITKGHANNMARRVMVKVFLQHLWLTWRELEGLPTSMPYAHEQMHHEHYYRRVDFGWPGRVPEDVGATIQEGGLVEASQVAKYTTEL